MEKDANLREELPETSRERDMTGDGCWTACESNPASPREEK